MNYYLNYTSVGDVITIIICIIFMILLRSTYTTRKNNIKLFYAANGLCIVSAVFSLSFHVLLQKLSPTNAFFANLLANMMYISLITMFVVFIMYLKDLIRLKGKEAINIHRIIVIAYMMFFVGIVSSSVTYASFYIDKNYVVKNNFYFNAFNAAYAFYAIILIAIIIVYRKHFITKVRRCLQGIMMMSFICMVVQLFFGQTSYTCMTFTFPILASLFLFHYNAYDPETGSLDEKSFASYIDDFEGKAFSLIFMTLKDVTDVDREKMTEHFFHFNEQFFNEPCTFRMKEERMIMVYPIANNPDAKLQYERLLIAFNKLYEEFLLDYKLVFVDSDDRIKGAKQYIGLCEMIEDGMQWGNSCWATEANIEQFLKREVIERALKDINDKMDLEDERVRVYCQPVLNTNTNKFTTAEALMRIVLPDYGFLYPDQFIPVAEKNGYIHSLSKIILHKTCKKIIELENAGYIIERVSVNFSMIELKDSSFCDDLIKIISDTGLEHGKIAIELTESRNEEDFEMVKNVMSTLQHMGIKFYLDDFGTGYSNFARIIGLPIDIIKFDRSLTIMSGADEASRYMVGSFSDIFENSKYQVLFEGVEDDSDEQRCMDMKAQYLQGYKYSKPIPMEDLYKFLEKKTTE